MNNNPKFSHKLVLQNNPFRQLLLSGLITIGLTVAGLSVIYVNLPKNYVFSCKKIGENTSNCNFVKNDLWLGLKQETVFKEINAAIVATLSGEDISQESYLVKLKTPDDNFTIVGYKSEDKTKSISSKINGFIANKKERNLNLEFSSEFNQGEMLLGLLFFTLGMGCLITIIVIPYYREISFDKTTNQILIQHRGWLQSRVIEHKLSEAIELIKEEKTDKDNDSKTQYILLMSGNERISLSSYTNSKWKSELEMVETLAAFLNLQITHQQIKI